MQPAPAATSPQVAVTTVPVETKTPDPLPVPPEPASTAGETPPGAKTIPAPPSGQDPQKTPEQLMPLLKDYAAWWKTQERRTGAHILTKIRAEENDGRAVLHVVLAPAFFTQTSQWRATVADAMRRLWAEKTLEYKVGGRQLVPATVFEDSRGNIVHLAEDLKTDNKRGK